MCWVGPRVFVCIKCLDCEFGCSFYHVQSRNICGYLIGDVWLVRSCCVGVGVHDCFHPR